MSQNNIPENDSENRVNFIELLNSEAAWPKKIECLPKSYRIFLEDYYALAKGKNQNFSFRSFSRFLGIKPESRIFSILSGKAGLSDKLAESIAEKIGLNHPFCNYFIDLVKVEHCRSLKERELAKKRVESFVDIYCNKTKLDQGLTDFIFENNLECLLTTCSIDGGVTIEELESILNIQASKLLKLLQVFIDREYMIFEGNRYITLSKKFFSYEVTNKSQIDVYKKKLQSLQESAIDPEKSRLRCGFGHYAIDSNDRDQIIEIIIDCLTRISVISKNAKRKDEVVLFSSEVISLFKRD